MVKPDKTMSTILYADIDGEERRINRDEYHTDKADLLTAFDRPDSGGVENKVSIPLSRVVKIVG